MTQKCFKMQVSNCNHVRRSRWQWCHLHDFHHTCKATTWHLLVRLPVCQSLTGRNVKPIFTKLHKMVELVISKKSIDLKAKGQQPGRISKIINSHLIDLKFEEDLDIRSLNSTTNYFWGQHRPKVNNFYGAISKILHFHPIDLKF